MPPEIKAPSGNPAGAPSTPDGEPCCSVERAIHAIGGKWKMLVLRALLLNGTHRYNRLLAEVSGISPKELTRNLRELEADGLVARAGSTNGQRVEYSLTALGRRLLPAFERLADVGERLPARDTEPGVSKLGVVRTA